MTLLLPCLPLLCCWFAWRRQPPHALTLITCFFLTPAAPLLSPVGTPLLLLPLLLVAWMRLDRSALEPRADQIKLTVLALAATTCAWPQIALPFWLLLPLIPFHVAWRGPLQSLRPADSLLLSSCLAILLLTWAGKSSSHYPLWGIISAAYLAILALAQKDLRPMLLYQVLALSSLTWALPPLWRAQHSWFLLPLALEHLSWAAANPGHSPTSKLACQAGPIRPLTILLGSASILTFSPLAQILLPLPRPLPFAASLVHLVLAIAPLKLILPGLPLPKPFHANPLTASPPSANP